MSKTSATLRRPVGLAVLIVAAALSLGEVAAQGLTAVERGQISSTLGQSEDEGRTLSDVTLMERLQAHATESLGLRVRPARIDSLWSIQPPVRDPLANFEEARAQGGLDSWLRALEPSDPRYLALAAETRRYRLLADQGEWPVVPGRRVVQPGEASADVAALRVRLAAEGYAPPPQAAAEVLDAPLVEALRTFQLRHGTPPDGVLGPMTRAALAVPAAARAAQLEANLERWRWLPRPLPADRIEVDIGSQTAVVFAAGEPVLTMRTVVGDVRHRTPMLASNLDAVVFNPPWNVPASIASAEIAPRVARDPGYLARNRMIRTATGFQQRPGPGNALGRLKFDLVSPFGVYLHDTSARSLFASPTRTLSHGCVRLEKPNELAALLLARQGWTPADVQAAIEAGATRRIALEQPLPLFVVYWTATVGDDGAANFGSDPYGWDRKLQRALGAAQH